MAARRRSLTAVVRVHGAPEMRTPQSNDSSSVIVVGCAVASLPTSTTRGYRIPPSIAKKIFDDPNRYFERRAPGDVMVDREWHLRKAYRGPHSSPHKLDHIQ